MTEHSSSQTLFSAVPERIPVDAEHLGIRILMPILAVVGIAGGFAAGVVLPGLIDESIGTVCFSLGFAFVGAALMLQIGERVIKPLWRSGRALEVSTQALELIDNRRGKQNQRFEWQQPLEMLAYFWEVEIGKSRVKRGWYCVTLRFEYDEYEAILYTFMSPEDAALLPHFQERFFHLLPKARREQLVQSNPREAAIQERYRKIEGYRYFDGAEIDAAAFTAIVVLADNNKQLKPLAT